jgi:chemotaxis methyl-accepting protein methylase
VTRFDETLADRYGIDVSRLYGRPRARLERGGALTDEGLIEAATVQVSSFLRHPEQYRWLAAQVWPTPEDGVLRVLSAGCAQGEEAYSLAAVLTPRWPGASLAVLGLDLNGAAIEHARRAIYSTWALRGAGLVAGAGCSAG